MLKLPVTLSTTRDLPVLLRHMVNYVLSGEGLHLAFQLRCPLSPPLPHSLRLPHLVDLQPSETNFALDL